MALPARTAWATLSMRCPAVCLNSLNMFGPSGGSMYVVLVHFYADAALVFQCLPRHVQFHLNLSVALLHEMQSHVPADPPNLR
eukprot:3881495-Pyramimonas_sp.AAC.1